MPRPPFRYRNTLYRCEDRAIVPKPQTPSDIYAQPNTSIAQRITLALFIGLWLALAWWLLLGKGFETIDGWSGLSWRSGDPIRSICLAIALSIYYFRLFFTWFAFLKRGISWKEAFTIIPWVLCIFLTFTICGGTNPTHFGAAAITGLILFIAGSWTNSYAEYTRNRWKQRPENRGHLYTQGWFRYTMHPNYFGDLVSFSGLCLISGRPITFIIPLFMLCGFVFANIPMLDSHLSQRYGAAFAEYAQNTKKLIPYIY
jgi:protein-S-isoprenylcysteine O-methyltransferase Ste14